MLCYCNTVVSSVLTYSKYCNLELYHRHDISPIENREKIFMFTKTLLNIWNHLRTKLRHTYLWLVINCAHEKTSAVYGDALHNCYDRCRWQCSINALRPRQNGRYSAYDIFKCILLNENLRILITISLKFVPNGSIEIMPALFLVTAWHGQAQGHYLNRWRSSLLAHKGITRPQWINNEMLYFSKLRASSRDSVGHSMKTNSKSSTTWEDYKRISLNLSQHWAS